MIATNPITIDGKTYDRYSINLAITGKYKADGSPDACINLMLIPTRIENGEVELAQQSAGSILRGSLAEVTDPAEIAAISSIQAALQTYITAKGL